MEALLTFSNPHNPPGVSQGERIPPGANTMEAYAARVMSWKTGQTDLTQNGNVTTTFLAKNIHWSLLDRSHVHISMHTVHTQPVVYMLSELVMIA